MRRNSLNYVCSSYKYISLRKQGIHLSIILQFYNFSAHCVRVNNTLVLFLMPNWQVYVCESVRARACVCAFNSFGMIMRKIKHTPHTAVHAHLKCWVVEWESKLCYGWVRFLTGKWSAPAALSMLFMCHALLTHLICLKSTILKHSPFPIYIYTHTLTWEFWAQRFIALQRQHVVWVMNTTTRSLKKREKAIFMHRHKWKSIK